MGLQESLVWINRLHKGRRGYHLGRPCQQMKGVKAGPALHEN